MVILRKLLEEVERHPHMFCINKDPLLENCLQKLWLCGQEEDRRALRGLLSVISYCRVMNLSPVHMIAKWVRAMIQRVQYIERLKAFKDNKLMWRRFYICLIVIKHTNT